MYEQSISVSAARLFSGKRLRLLAEYQRSALNPGALVLNSQAFERGGGGVKVSYSQIIQ